MLQSRSARNRFNLSQVVPVVLLLVGVLASCSSDANVQQSELSAYERMSLGLIGSSEEAALKRALIVEKQTLIASCMAEQGFDYIPNKIDTLGVPEPDRPQLGTIAFAEQLGFGASIDPAASVREITDPTVDQNGAYRNSLEAGAQLRYDRQLEDCDLRSVPEVDGVSVAVLDQRINEAMQRAESSSRFVDINAEWAACASEFGVAEATYGALVTTFLDRYEAVRRDPESLDSLQTEERRIAVQTFDCTKGYLDSVAELVADLRNDPVTL